MRLAFIIIMIILAVWLQLVFPAVLAPWQIVPSFTLLVSLALALYYEPRDQVVWLALLAGLAVDLWQPSHFGTWSLASVLTVLVTRLVHLRLLPRAHWLSILATAGVALAAGELVVFLREAWGLNLGTIGQTALRLYVPHLILDLVITIPVTLVIRSLLRTLRATHQTHTHVHSVR